MFSSFRKKSAPEDCAEKIDISIIDKGLALLKCTIDDVTKTANETAKILEEKIDVYNRQQAATANMIENVVFIVDENQIIRGCNAAFISFVNETKSINVIGKFVYQLLPDFPVDNSMWKEELWHSFYRDQSISLVPLANRAKICILKPTQETI